MHGRRLEVSPHPAASHGGQLETLLAGGDPLSLDGADVAASLVLHQPDGLGELLECVFSHDPTVRMRASDALEKVCRDRPDLLQPYVPRLLSEMSRIEQPSVQWYLAQILSQVQLEAGQRAAAVAIFEHNLVTVDDWILVSLTLEAFSVLARADPALRARLVVWLGRYTGSGCASVARRARRLLAEFGREVAPPPTTTCRSAVASSPSWNG